MKRLIMAASMLLVLAFGLFAVTPSSVSAGDQFSCPNFATYDQAYAQFVLDGGPQSDPNRLDGDGDGFPCEDNRGAPAAARTAPQCVFPRSPCSGTPPTVAATATATTVPVQPTATSTTAPTATTVPGQPTATTAPAATATATTVPGEPTDPAAPATVTVAPPVQLPGEIAPDAITVAAFAAVDDALAPTITYTVSGDSTAFTGGIAKQADGTAIDAAALAPASGVTFVVIDQATGQTVDAGTTNADGLVTLDGEYGVPVFVIVGGTDIGSDAFTIADGGTASVNVVIYRFSAGAPSAVTPTVAAPPTAVTTAAPSAAGGAVTLPNTGTGDDSAPALSWWLALFAAMSAVVIGAGMLMFGRKSS